MSPLSFPTQTVVPDTTATATSPAVVTPTPLVSPSPPSLPLQELPPSPTPQRTPSHSQTAPGPDGANERPVPPTPSRSLSPGPGTAEPTDDLDQTASEQGRLPSPEGAFTFDGSSGFITVDAIKYLQTVRAGRRWTDMVTSYLRLEELPISPAVRTFHSLSFAQTDDIIRPLFAYPLNLGQMRYSRWIKNRSFTPNHTPFVSDVPSYRKSWILWWTSCQPSWRRKAWPLPRDNEGTTNWMKIGARGRSGLLLVVLSTAWWAFSIKSNEEWVIFDEAVDDVEWVIGQVTDSSKALEASTPAPAKPAPAKPAPSKKSQKPKSNVGWLVRPAGKRQPKPSRKLLESGAL